MFTHGESEDEDVVVEEIPIFLAKNMQDNLNLFQYPTKSYVSNYDNAHVLECKVRPLNKEVKLDIALDIESPYYDRSKGKLFALGADAKNAGGKQEAPLFKRGIMDKQVLTSTHTLDDVFKYVGGIYVDREIHLTPLNSILQLRPSFSYIEHEDKRRKAEEKAAEQDQADEEEEEELQAVTVKFAKPGAAGKKLKQKQSYESLQKQIEEEPWLESFWHARSTPIAELERQRLYCTSQDVSSAFSQNIEKYVDKLLPRDGNCLSIDDLLPPLAMSKARLRPLQLVDQLKHILKDGKVLRFDDIYNFVQKNFDYKITADKLVRLLPQVGVLMHGNWLVQSELLYPPETFSNANGVPAEQMIRARNYVLYRLTRTSYLNRCQIVNATQLPPTEATEVLQSVAKLNQDLRWELLLPPDRDFEQRYPDQVMRQKLTWNAFAYRDHDSPKRVRKRSQRDSICKSTSRSDSQTSQDASMNPPQENST